MQGFTSMGKINIGDKFGMLVVLQRASTPSTPLKQPRWLCECDCGMFTEVMADNLRKGRTISCGHYGKSLLPAANLTHGKTDTLEYGIWCAMKRRCYSPSTKDFNNYGGRGIKVCDRWLVGEDNKHPFVCFLEDIGERPEGDYSIDRKENDGDYTPQNCVWADRAKQNSNRRNTVLHTHNGVSLTLSGWAKKLGKPASTLRSRYYTYGYTLKETLYGRNNENAST